jgi:hypothetical protein
LSTYGSYRNIQQLNTQDPVYITNVIPDSEPMRPELIAVIILAIINGLLIGLIGYYIITKCKRLDKIFDNTPVTPYEKDQDKF